MDLPFPVTSLSESLVHFDYPVLLKLMLSCLLGGLIGLEREKKRKPVGIKTCMIIAVTTCLLTVVSIQAAESICCPTNNRRGCNCTT